MRQQSLSPRTGLIRSSVNRYAVIGVLVSVVALVVATGVSSLYLFGEISLPSLIRSQQQNAVLWFLDAMPFAFAVWGQYVGSVVADQAGALVIDHTRDLQAQTEALEHQVMYDSLHDALTNLPNRVLFRDRVCQAINSAKRDGRKLAILLLDLDRFKEINDTMGHFNGDRILKQVSSRLRETTRGSDTLARLGGDEFALLLPAAAGIENVKTVARTIEHALLPSFYLSGMPIQVEASIGAVIYPDHGTDADALLQRADIAMYIAKRKGKAFAVYSRGMDQHSPHRLTLMGELREAIENDELVLYFQPKVERKTDRVAGAEALVRWRHREHGVITPDDFIPLAERTGLITQLTHWVLKSALHQVTLWQQAGIEIGVAVNLSARNLLDPEFPDLIAGMLASYDVAPQRLTLEITETAIIAEPDLALEILQRIAAMGARFSIDDFGTGYSSLAYLKRLPVSEIKIDKSFVMEMCQNENDAVIVRATIDMGHNLGLSVVAEGVSDAQATRQLAGLGCDLLQGHFIAPPMTAPELAQWYRQRLESAGEG